MAIQQQKNKFSDKEVIHFNIAKLKKGGEWYEIDVDPELAMAFKEGKAVDIKDALKSEKIMNNIQKREFASEHRMKELFGTDDHLKIAEIIIREGIVQLTEDYRVKQREEKLTKIIGMIHMNAIDARTNSPLPTTRIENAIKEARLKVDDSKSAEDQLEMFIKKLTVVLPMRFEVDSIEISVPAKYSSKSNAIVKKLGKVKKEEWNNDGSLVLVVEVPAGLRGDLVDQIEALTHGEAEIKIVEMKKNR